MLALENLYLHYSRETTQNIHIYVKTLSTYYLGFRKAAVINCQRVKALFAVVLFPDTKPHQSISFEYYVISKLLIFISYIINFTVFLVKVSVNKKIRLFCQEEMSQSVLFVVDKEFTLSKNVCLLQVKKQDTRKHTSCAVVHTASVHNPQFNGDQIQ